MSSMQSAMNFLKRRFSDTNFTGLANGYMVDRTSDDEAGPEPPMNNNEKQPLHDHKHENIMRKISAVTALQHATASNKQDTQKPTTARKTTSGYLSSTSSAAHSPADRENEVVRMKTLLVVDDQHTDWAQYFVGRKVHNDFMIHVEQASFDEMAVIGHSQNGVTVDITCTRHGNRVVRSFRPDFILIRQPPRSMSEGRDYRNIVIGLKYGGVPSVNSLHSIYNFMDRPWTFAQLIRIQRRLGADKFPLVEQTYFPSSNEMLTASNFPVVIKVGHAQQGKAKIKADNHHQFQDVAGLVALTGQYAVCEQYVEALYDIRVQKIGANYKVYKRTSISNNWKANTGSAMVEEIPMTDEYRLWVDACSEMFGGLDIVAVKAVHGKDGRNYIIEVSDCTLQLIGEKQEEDRQLIAELTTQRLNACTRSFQKRPQSYNQSHSANEVKQQANPKPAGRSNSSLAPTTDTSFRNATAPSTPKRDSSSQNSNKDRSTTVHQLPRRTSAPSSPNRPRAMPRTHTMDDEDKNAEKIRNLRKSFGNLFGD